MQEQLLIFHGANQAKSMQVLVWEMKNYKTGIAKTNAKAVGLSCP
jgi:hypothetical protein